jgi:hypothetical protein
MISLDFFLDKVKNESPISFHETILVITENYHYHPTAFSNGIGDDIVENPAGSNEGSCKIFAFAKLHGLSQEHTLTLFGDYYRTDVLLHPEGTNHQNIRNFMKYGWDGIHFSGQALTTRQSTL